jgi:hypothetical protein
MTENISTAEEFIAGNKAIISEDTVEDVIEFLYDLKAEGSPALEGEIDFVLRGIEDGYFLKGIGISID